MKHQGLVEKHAAASSVPNLHVAFATFNGPDAMNDTSPAGAADIVLSPDANHDATPPAAAKWADFRSRAGCDRNATASWKDLFLPEIRDLPGS